MKRAAPRSLLAQVEGATAAIVIAAVVAITLFVTKPASVDRPVSVERSVEDIVRPASPMPSAEPEVATHAAPADPVDAYLAMRDDLNAKPRLQWIEDRVRDRAAPDTLTLLGHAMTDPDEAVRERATALYDRALGTGDPSFGDFTSDALERLL